MLHPVAGGVLRRGLKFQTCTNTLNNFFNNSENLWVPPRIQKRYFSQIYMRVFNIYEFKFFSCVEIKCNLFTVRYSLPNIVRVVKSRIMRWAGHVAHMGEGRGVHRVLVGKPEGKRPLGRPRRRWEDNIKMELQEMGGSCGDWMEMAQDRDRWRALVSTVRNLRVPKMRGIS